LPRFLLGHRLPERLDLARLLVDLLPKLLDACLTLTACCGNTLCMRHGGEGQQ